MYGCYKLALSPRQKVPFLKGACAFVLKKNVNTLIQNINKKDAEIRTSIAAAVCMQVTCSTPLDWWGWGFPMVHRRSAIKQQHTCYFRIYATYCKGRLRKLHRAWLHLGPVSPNLIFTWPYVERHFNFYFRFQKTRLIFYCELQWNPVHTFFSEPEK